MKSTHLDMYHHLPIFIVDCCAYMFVTGTSNWFLGATKRFTKKNEKGEKVTYQTNLNGSEAFFDLCPPQQTAIAWRAFSGVCIALMLFDEYLDNQMLNSLNFDFDKEEVFYKLVSLDFEAAVSVLVGSISWGIISWEFSKASEVYHKAHDAVGYTINKASNALQWVESHTGIVDVIKNGIIMVPSEIDFR